MAQVHAEVVRIAGLPTFPAGYEWGELLTSVLWVAASEATLQAYGDLALPTAAIETFRHEMRRHGIGSPAALGGWLQDRDGGQTARPFQEISDRALDAAVDRFDPSRSFHSGVLCAVWRRQGHEEGRDPPPPVRHDIATPSSSPTGPGRAGQEVNDLGEADEAAGVGR